ncbi:MAG: hypothetical protein ACOYIT_07045 [Christensenellales bacterium]|jgi:hypothetical protein
MYTQENLSDIESQLKRRLMACALPAAALLALFIYSLVIRVEWLSYFLSMLLCFYIIFAWGIFISPVRSYKKFIYNMLYLKNRNTQGHFKGFIDVPTKREGVLFTPFFINIGNMENEEDDRLFYYDSNLPLPDWQPGDKLSITSHDKSTVAWEKL